MDERVGPNQQRSRIREDDDAIGQSRALLGQDARLERRALERSESKSLSGAIMLQHKLHGAMA